jgi:hypothetical protein
MQFAPVDEIFDQCRILVFLDDIADSFLEFRFRIYDGIAVDPLAAVFPRRLNDSGETVPPDVG